MGPAPALRALSERLGDAADRLEEPRVEELAARAGFNVSCAPSSTAAEARPFR
jgi:hypothetical protein